MSKSTKSVAVVPTVTFNVEALQALGVETKISKADLMEYITSNIEEQLLAAKKEKVERLDEIVRDYHKRLEAAEKAFATKLENDERIKALAEAFKALDKAKEALFGQDFSRWYQIASFRLKDFYRAEWIHSELVKHDDSVCRGVNLCGIEVEYSSNHTGLTEKFAIYTVEEANALNQESVLLNSELNEIYNGLRNLSTHAKAARMAMLKSILSGTAEGKNLLSFLDSRARNYKALNSAAT